MVTCPLVSFWLIISLYRSLFVSLETGCRILSSECFYCYINRNNLYISEKYLVIFTILRVCTFYSGLVEIKWLQQDLQITIDNTTGHEDSATGTD